jgi:SNF2 family DNA or RNA helicase
VLDLIRAFPDQKKWHPSGKFWTIKPTLRNLEHIDAHWPDATWDEKSGSIYRRKVKERNSRDAIEQREITGDLAGVVFKHPPFDHQGTALLLGRDTKSFAYFMDQGTGKTKVLLDDAAHNYREGRINFLLVLCPNSVKTNYPAEIETHLAPDIPRQYAIWYSGPNKDQKEQLEKFLTNIEDGVGGLHILVANIDALRVKRFYDLAAKLSNEQAIMIAVDESTRIKKSTAQRTKRATALRKNCKLARIMTGTPIIKTPLDAYGQLRFLDEDILGYSSFYAFRNHYAIMGGFGGYQVQSYQNIDDLERRIRSCSFRVEKHECLDLPEKMYAKRIIEMTNKQAIAYSEMRDISSLFLEDFVDEHGELTAQIKLAQLLRLQQITSGFLPIVDDVGTTIDTQFIGADSPKIKEALSIIEECNHKVIVWGRFKPELYELYNQLSDEAVIFTGDQNDEERQWAREAFQDPDSSVRVFIGQVATGGVGINLFRGQTVIYLSNSFSTEDRVQSEDRAHRIGTQFSVQYIDLIVEGTVDELIVDTLRGNKRLSDVIMGDAIREWI